MQLDVELNPSQEAIVNTAAPAILVVAGPGAGKTTVLKERITRILLNDQLKYARVLAITFTNVAAANLRNKLGNLPAHVLDRVDIGTFHAFATKLLQQHGSHIGLTPDFSIVNELGDREELLKLALQRISWKPKSESSLLPLLSRLYERSPSDDEFETLLDVSLDVIKLRLLFDEYAKISIELGQLDFSLLVFLANRVLAKFPMIARQTRKRYRYICVDEFQDTNDAQFKLLSALCASSLDGLLFLADQDQLIYQWNGASPRRLTEARDFFSMSVMLLPTSFRCPNNIMAAATRLIRHNSARMVTPEFDSVVPDDGNITCVELETDQDEAAYLSTLLKSYDLAKINETVVLARNRKLLDLAMRVCEEQGVACSAPLPRFEFTSAPIVMLHSILRLANRPNDYRRLGQLIVAFHAITGVELDADILLGEASAKESTALNGFLDATLRRSKSSEYADLARCLEDELIARKDFRNVSGRLFTWFDALADSERKESLVADFTDERPVWLSLETLHKGLVSANVSLGAFLRAIDLESKAPVREDTVRFMTVHGTKGLEYSNVFLIGLAEEQFPTFQAVRAGAQSDSMEEERRSCFVAITRCKKALTLTYARRYSGYSKQRSRFLSEMDLK